MKANFSGRLFANSVKDALVQYNFRSAPVSGNMEDICLKDDNGQNIRFQGRLFSECSYFDEETRCLTRQQLYVTDNRDQVYYIVRSCGHDRSRRAYRLAVRDDNCVIHNGTSEITLQFDMLMLAVRALCGLSAEDTPSLASVEEVLKAANA